MANLKETVEEVYQKLKIMPQEEFDKLLKEHENGDIAQLLLHANCFDYNKSIYVKDQLTISDELYKKIEEIEKELMVIFNNDLKDLDAKINEIGFTEFIAKGEMLNEDGTITPITIKINKSIEPCKEILQKVYKNL